MTLNEFSDKVEQSLKAQNIEYTAFNIEVMSWVLTDYDQPNQTKRYSPVYRVFVYKEQEVIYHSEGSSPNECLIDLLGQILTTAVQLDIELPN